LGLKLSRVKEKIEEEKIRCDLVDPVKNRLQPVDFCFLLKRYHFDLKKNN
jgi:hypothetical protein